jgi:hypothetical protein
MQIELTEYVVTIREKMTWGAKEAIQSEGMSALIMTGDPRKIEQTLNGGGNNAKVQLNGEAIFAAKLKAIEVFIESITTRDGKAIPFSMDWLKNLPVEDGDKIDNAVTEIRSKIKEGN